MDHLLNIMLDASGPMPYVMVFLILIACGLGVPIPEDITLFAAGMLAYYGNVDENIIVAVSFVGIMLGDSIIFVMGRRYGGHWVKKGFLARILPLERLNQVEKKFAEHGNKIIFAARFMPGLRALVYFCAGTLKLPYRIFLFYDGAAATISVPTIIYLVHHFGDKVDAIIKVIRKAQHGIIIAILVVILFYVVKWFFSRRKSAS
jgi:membrane protein DedA with SNARE-associated domain